MTHTKLNKKTTLPTKSLLAAALYSYLSLDDDACRYIDNGIYTEEIWLHKFVREDNIYLHKIWLHESVGEATGCIPSI